jgi:hypothetical protein
MAPRLPTAKISARMPVQFPSTLGVQPFGRKVKNPLFGMQEPGAHSESCVQVFVASLEQALGSAVLTLHAGPLAGMHGS